MLAALLAVLIAMRVRWPVTEFGLPSTERAIAYAHYDEWNTQQAQGAFSLQIRAATVGQHIVSKHKVDLVRRAMHFFVIALALLVAGVIVGLVVVGPEGAQPPLPAQKACRLSQLESASCPGVDRDSAIPVSPRVVSAGMALSRVPVALWVEGQVCCHFPALMQLLSTSGLVVVFSVVCGIPFMVPSIVLRYPGRT
jgi:hypothetical protein